MLAWLNRYVLQPLDAWRSGSHHLEYLKELERRQWEPPDTIQQRQWESLRQQLSHAFHNVPYYRQRWSALGIHPNDIRTPADLAALPVLTKADVRRHHRQLLADGVNQQRLHVKRTSGSTGVPVVIQVDETAMQWKRACTLRSDQWSGWRLGQRVAKVWGNPEYRQQGWKGRLRNYLLDRARYLDTLAMTPVEMVRFAASLRHWRPGLIFGHAHSLYLLAECMRQHNITDIRPAGIIATAMVLHNWQRRVIEAVFATPVTNRYGCEEVSLIASECEQHHGLHVNTDNIYLEIVDLQPTDNGEYVGRALITDLVNRAMPLIRYQVGDMVVPSTRRCPCGRGLPLIERVEGREADYVVTPAGQLISGISLTENFALLIPGAAQVQIIQETIDELTIKIVPDDQFDSSSHKRIRELVKSIFGPEVKYTVEIVDTITPERNGKYRFCISKVTASILQSII